MLPPEGEEGPEDKQIFTSYGSRPTDKSSQGRWVLTVAVAAVVIILGLFVGAGYFPNLKREFKARGSDTPFAPLVAQLRPAMSSHQVAEALGTPYISDFEIDNQQAWVYHVDGTVFPFFVLIRPELGEIEGWCVYAADDKPGVTEVQVFAPGGMNESGTMQWISSKEKMLPTPTRYMLNPTDSDKPGIGTSAPTLYTLRSIGTGLSPAAGGYGVVELNSFNLRFDCHRLDENTSASDSRVLFEPPPPPPPPPPPGTPFKIQGSPPPQPPSTSLQTSDSFLILDSSDGRHIVVLRDSIVASVTKPGESFEANAASLAGVIYAARNGPVSKEKAAAFSEELAWKASVRRLHRLSELFRDGLKVPKGWGDAQVVAVFWRTDPQN